MADVTDVAFRFIISKYSKDKSAPRSFSEVGFITYTEFVSADGLVRAPEEGRRKLLKDLEYSEIERPIVAQFFTSKPDMMEKAAALAVELGFDGVDINMGCPDQSIEKQGAGAALIKNPPLARELIRAAKRGVNEKIPVSVKTRLGYNKDELETWLPELLAENPAAIIIHARTRREMSKVPARWERIKRAVEIRDSISEAVAPKNQEKTLIIGNGDVESVEDAILKCEQTGADGAMLGRAIFGTPYLFSNSREWYQEKNNPEVVRKILGILVEHTHLFEEKLGNIKSFAIMKKHFKSYLSGLEGAKELKEKLMDTNNASEVAKIVSDFLVYNK
jgi:nifR3 family TIM-barrel protein